MNKKNPDIVKQYLLEFVRYIQSRSTVSKQQCALLCHFTKLFYSHIAPEDLEHRSFPHLYALLLSHWELIYTRLPSECHIRIHNPENTGNAHTLIEVVWEDRPFLVDSLRMEISRQGLNVHCQFNLGGIGVKRNGKGELTHIMPANTQKKGVKNETVICLEVDRQTDLHSLENLRINLLRVLNDVKLAVDDWPVMKGKMEEAALALVPEALPTIDASEVEETRDFLYWLNSNFTFLGYRAYKVDGEGEKQALRIMPHTGLGVLRDGSASKVSRYYSELPAGVRKLALSSKTLLIIAKTNTYSTVHRQTYTDYIGLKRFDKKGAIIGEHRFVGLFTSSTYNKDPSQIPVLRRKVEKVMKRSGLSHNTHLSKRLLHILRTLPRDDLIQASDKELFSLSMGVMHLNDRRQVRLFLRRDVYHRFVSCLVYMPRENFNTQVRIRIQKLLLETFVGFEVSFNPHFSESPLACVHYIIRTDPKRRLSYQMPKLEARIQEIARSWQDDFRDRLLRVYGEEEGNSLFDCYRYAFPASYQEAFSVEEAVHDLPHITQLDTSDALGMALYRSAPQEQNRLFLRLFRKKKNLQLSDVLPMLENMGLRVLGEHPYHLDCQSGTVWINNYEMMYAYGNLGNIDILKKHFHAAFHHIWRGNVENDSLNRLVLAAGLSWQEVTVLRGYAKYLRQIGIPFSQPYIEDALHNNAKLCRLFIDLFHCRFSPGKDRDRAGQEIAHLEALFLKQLDSVTSLDEDRIMRRYLEVLKATVRVNYYQQYTSEEGLPYLAFKFEPQHISDLPFPVPKYECFVYSPRFEGIHLRSDKVARGGIRWSDRREDFRTEVLGLTKAQNVKNALIVPAGAKGGFVPKRLPPNDQGAEAVFAEGRACYIQFVTAMLDITDNIVNKKIVKPADTVCWDEDDPYLVVAADKGTATFSDVANAVSCARNFWLFDAFASGGSAGYDHKKMGITSRGAWESVKRHFYELDIAFYEKPFTVVGIGDMSGDVFGNGMLFSDKIQLIAAFNHKHIFLDPSPDPTRSFAERKRLFQLPRSSWSDYDKTVLSPGGGIFSRRAKSIALSSEIRAVLGIEVTSLVPNVLIQYLLRAPVDLLWNGGIGTYVKASTETQQEVGDRSNDALRINANTLRCKVVGEGGNLGLTQLARIEYALSGGRINTDFIDNASGVNCSDKEVNIKILLMPLLNSKQLSLKQRNRLLSRMQEAVADIVLYDNYRQNLSLAIAQRRQSTYLNLYGRYLEIEEEEGHFNRAQVFLPDEKALVNRRAKLGKGLTSPENAVLLAYSKMILHDELLASDLPDDAAFNVYLQRLFPEVLSKKYLPLILSHYLRRKIIATQLSNALIHDMGMIFMYQMRDELGVTVPTIVRAYVATRRIFHFEEIWKQIEGVACQVPAALQIQMFEALVRLTRRAIRWFLRNRSTHFDIASTVQFFTPKVKHFQHALPRYIRTDNNEAAQQRTQSMQAAGVPDVLAQRIAYLPLCYPALNVIEAAKEAKKPMAQVAQVYFALSDQLGLEWLREQIDGYPVDSKWSLLSRSSFKDDLDRYQRKLTVCIVNTPPVSKRRTGTTDTQAHTQDAVLAGGVLPAVWLQAHQTKLCAWEKIANDLRKQPKVDLVMISVALKYLQDLADA